MAFIEAQQVRFSYDAESVDAREVLHGVDLSIEEGEFVALLGHNGCGKSTMAKLFNGMLVPTAGKVLVGGIDTSVEETQLDVRRQVGLVLQNPDNQLVAGVVEEDVAFGPENLGVPPEEIRRRNIQRRKEYYETAQGYYNSMLDVLDLAYLTVNHEKIPPNVLKEWVKLITDELSQISKIKRSDKARA